MFTKLMLLLAAPVVLGAQQMSDSAAFRPISMTEAVRLAKENNVGAITANNQIRSANLQVRSARAQLYPNVTVTAGQGKSAGDRLGQSGTIVPFNSAWTYQTGLSVQ